MTYELVGIATTAVVDTKGAELLSLVDVLGQEHLWCGDPEYWGRRAPILFPIIGCLKGGETLIDGKPYRIPKHGFARDEEFTLVSQEKDSITLSLRDNERLFKLYPYHFELLVSYQVGANSVATRFTVRNLDEKPIYFCIGGHPAFRCPVSGEDPFESYELQFEEKEDIPCLTLDEEGIIQTGRERKLLCGEDRLALSHGLFDDDALIFDHPKSKQCTLMGKLSGQGVKLSFEGFTTLGVWTPQKKNAPFVCLEPWIGMADWEEESGVFAEKKDIVCLPVGETYCVSYQMEII